MAKKIALSKVKEYNRALRTPKAVLPDVDENDVKHTIEETMTEFKKEIYDTRQGKVEHPKTGKMLPARDISFAQAVELKYGADLETFYEHLGIYTSADTLESAANRLGINSFNRATLEAILVEAGQFASPNSTKDFPTDYRFLIAEVVTQAIRTGYQNASQHENWIASTQNMPQRKLTMPRIERGNSMPMKINEGAAIPTGSLRFGKKDVSVYKIGTGFDMTDELITASTIDLVLVFLAEVGNDMSIGADVEALRTLVSGEQPDLSESAPVVGVLDTTKGYQYKDFKKIFSRMARLKRPAGRLVTSEDDSVDITSIDRFEGFQGDTRLASIQTIIGVPERFENDVHVLPTGQILFLADKMAMVKLRHKGLTVERRRNPQTQVEELYVSDHIGFAILRRDARVLLDKTVNFSAAGFPAYMDIDSRIAEAFKIG